MVSSIELNISSYELIYW
ncbi:hypothetical protein F383_15893 [Gossypium arboreum]|uniref:Uncharacterized protein n=1 Tax=Gossypium arboreum TaxID=29729 RepID=A0A0B0NIR3_GOSAR|nr:hypothetical protein F383_15893 [Gossypium arboreum]